MGTYKLGDGLVNGKRFYKQVAGKYFNKYNPNAIWYVESYEGKNYSNWILGYKKNVGSGVGGIMGVPLFRVGSGENWPNSPQNPLPLRPQDVEKWFWFGGGKNNAFCCKSSDYVSVIGKSLFSIHLNRRAIQKRRSLIYFSSLFDN